MFEHFCALLLRLYPAEFRRAYGPEAVQLMRDRASHERGVFLRLRLLMDLAIDLAAISLHGWRPARPSPAQADGPPRFDLIDIHGPRPEALAVGTMISMLMFAAFTLLFQPSALPNAFGLLSEPSGSAKRAAASNDPAQRTIAADAEARRRLVAAIAANLKQRYVDRAFGQQLADTLLTHDKKGTYDSLGLGANLAARINNDIQAASRARGIPRGVFVADVVYSERPLPSGPPPPATEEMRERRRTRLRELNCLFDKVETLPRNVGYIKLNGFAEPAACHDTTARAMASLNHAAALIIDLRDNGGGMGETALQIAGYLFDRPTLMYNPRPNSPLPARTASPIAGNTLAGKPVYLLTSSGTQSAAEYFVYNLKMLKRVTVVGEKTAGREHSGGFHRVTDHFGMGIQEAARPDNPYPVKGWEVIGIEPDVKVSSIDAVESARKLVESRLRAR